jgi:hypothetical protein
MKEFQGGLRIELKAQGHYLTGRLHDSIQYKITQGGDTVTAVIECEDYGLAMEFGVKSSRIPYTPGGGQGGTSRYIQGLIRFFELRGVTGRDAVSAAFATATVQSREGIPTANSFSFSSNGARTGFASTTLERDLAIIGRILEQTTGIVLQIEFADTVKMEPLILYS